MAPSILLCSRPALYRHCYLASISNAFTLLLLFTSFASNVHSFCLLFVSTTLHLQFSTRRPRPSLHRLQLPLSCRCFSRLLLIPYTTPITCYLFCFIVFCCHQKQTERRLPPSSALLIHLVCYSINPPVRSFVWPSSLSY